MAADLMTQLLNRRELLNGAGTLAALGAAQAYAGGHTGGERVILTPEQQQAPETAKVWRDFGYPGAEQLVQPAPKAS